MTATETMTANEALIPCPCCGDSIAVADVLSLVADFADRHARIASALADFVEPKAKTRRKSKATRKAKASKPKRRKRGTLTEADVRRIRKASADGMSVAAIARDFRNVTPSCVRAVVTGKTWTTVEA